MPERLPIRLGAMVGMEYVAERDPSLTGTALEAVWSRLSVLDTPVKGDMIYLIGELGDPSWTPRLEALLAEAQPEEIRDAIQEAREKISNKVIH